MIKFFPLLFENQVVNIKYINWIRSFSGRISRFVPAFGVSSALQIAAMGSYRRLQLLQSTIKVDERAVLKHFDWPESKADAFREASFEYQDLMKLEKQVTTFKDDPSIPCEKALKKMYSLLEKVEQSVYALLRTRDMAMSRYKDFGIPVNWLMDAGVVGKIKLSSVQLAKKCMKRVATELDVLTGPEKEPNREFLLLQGIRFAFRVHQFAGGFDAESMKTFEDLRSRVQSQNSEDNKAEM